MAQKGRRAQLESGPSVGRRVGKAEIRSGRVRAWRPSANSPDSCMNERERESSVLVVPTEISLVSLKFGP